MSYETVKDAQQLKEWGISDPLRNYLGRRMKKDYVTLRGGKISELWQGAWSDVLQVSEIVKNKRGNKTSNDVILRYENDYLHVMIFELLKDQESQTEAVIIPENLPSGLGGRYLDLGNDTESRVMLSLLFDAEEKEGFSEPPDTIIDKIESEKGLYNGIVFVAHHPRMNSEFSFAADMNGFIRRGISYKAYMEDRIRRFFKEEDRFQEIGKRVKKI